MDDSLPVGRASNLNDETKTMKLKTEVQATDKLKDALVSANGQTIKMLGRKWKLSCCEINGRFYCDAENLTPADATEAKFCITDLWKSESDDSVRLLYAFARLGGWVQTKAGILSPTMGRNAIAVLEAGGAL